SGTLNGSTLSGIGLAGTLTYLTMEQLTLGLGSAADTLTITGTHAGSTTLNTNGGADTLHIQATGGLTTVNSGAGADTVNVNGAAAALTVNTDADGDTVNVNGVSATLTVNTLAGNDTINVHGLDAATTVDAGEDDDTLNVGTLSEIDAALTVIGGSGASDVLNIDDAGNIASATGTLTASTLSGLGLA